MKNKNFIVEVLVAADGKRTYIVRNVPTQQSPEAAPLAVCQSEAELTQFFVNVQI